MNLIKKEYRRKNLKNDKFALFINSSIKAIHSHWQQTFYHKSFEKKSYGLFPLFGFNLGLK